MPSTENGRPVAQIIEDLKQVERPPPRHALLPSAKALIEAIVLEGNPGNISVITMLAKQEDPADLFNAMVEMGIRDSLWECLQGPCKGDLEQFAQRLRVRDSAMRPSAYEKLSEEEKAAVQWWAQKIHRETVTGEIEMGGLRVKSG